MALSPVHKLYSSQQHTLGLLGLLSLHQSSENDFQQQTLHTFRLAEQCPCLSHSNSWLTAKGDDIRFQQSSAVIRSSVNLFRNHVQQSNFPYTGDVLELPHFKSQSQNYITAHRRSANLSWGHPLYGRCPRTASLQKSKSKLYYSRSKSANLSWGQATILKRRRLSIFSSLKVFFNIVADLISRGTLSDERTGLWFTVAPGPRHRRLSVFREIYERILLSIIWYSQNLKGHVPVFISPRNRIAQLYPQALGPSTLTYALAVSMATPRG
jgi:hypothetical protein